MTKISMENEYFKWLCSLIFGENNSYEMLAVKLYNADFRYTIPMDGNREADGINLRYRFGRERGYEDYIIAEYLDISVCSVLEMMTALCIRIEDIMECDERDRTGEWFGEMLRSLGLDGQTDDRFDEEQVDAAITRFLDGDYGKNGCGGLFTVQKPCDMRGVELWYQAQYWMGEKLLE